LITSQTEDPESKKDRR